MSTSSSFQSDSPLVAKMLSLSLILSSAILLGAANSSPTALEALEQLAEQRTFSLQQIEVDREPRTLLDEITRTYMKYNVDPPSYVEAAIRDGPGTATTPAKSIGGDKEYLISVQVGNHNLTLDPDTGSADLYVLPNSPVPSNTTKIASFSFL